MKSYNHLFAQLRRIDRLWSASDFNPRYDELYRKAYKAFIKYKCALANYFAEDKTDGCIRMVVWDNNVNTKVPRKVYAGY